MSGINGKGQRSIKKQGVEESLIPSVTFKTVRFMHEASAGETVIDTQSLTAPTDATNNGFAQPSGSELGELNLLQYKNKVVVRSTLRPAMLQFIDYKISGANTINLIVPAQEGEIFEVIVSDDSKSGVTAVDATPLVKTFTLPAGSTDISVGPYQVGKYPNEQLGSLLVFADGQVQYRTVGNQPDGDGDYYELSNIIRFRNTDTSDRQVIVVSHSALIEEPEGSLLAMIETLAGQIDGIIPTLADLAGVDESTFQAAPNNADLKAFGDRLLQAEQDITTKEDEFDIEYQIKTLSGNIISSTTDISDLRFNNLEIGKTYKITMHGRLAPNDDCVVQFAALHDGSTILELGSEKDSGTTGGNELTQCGTSLVFTATATTLTFNVSISATGGLEGNGTTNQTFVMLEEKAQHKATTKWT